MSTPAVRSTSTGPVRIRREYYTTTAGIMRRKRTNAGVLPSLNGASDPEDAVPANKTMKTRVETPPNGMNDTFGRSGPADFPPWTDNQEVALLSAVKQVPAGADKNKRWKEIGILVEGHGRRDCYLKYKRIKAEKKRARRQIKMDVPIPDHLRQMPESQRLAAKTWSIGG
jgi:hypothetical protein